MPWKTCLFLVMAICGHAFGNAGVFFGSGQTIELGKSADVQMVSEDVNITPMRGGFLFDGTVDNQFLEDDRVTYDCEFVLRNRTKKLVKVQVGFPINHMYRSKRSGETPNAAEMSRLEADCGELVREYRFIARDHAHTYHLRFVPCDKHNRLDSIFVWNMSFEPDEVVHLHVSYDIHMSVAAGDTTQSHDHFDRWSARQQKLREQNHEWFSNLEFALCEWFEYVTETGKSWAGPIENATFRINVKGYENI